jgi:catechol 2,3-dioxygenase-like lactoylglutathione lyase family enzyme
VTAPAGWDHSGLYHVGFFVDDVPGAIARMSGTGLRWTDVQEHTMVLWRPGLPPEPITATGAYTLGGPVHLELTHIRSGPLHPPTDELVPHHLGHWCDDVMATTDALVAAGWAVEFMGGVLGEDPSISVVRAPNGYRIELVPTSSRSRIEAKLGVTRS